MGLVSEFQPFSMRGNVVGLGIGGVIGGAFSKIIVSFVDDIITPAVLTTAL